MEPTRIRKRKSRRSLPATVPPAIPEDDDHEPEHYGDFASLEEVRSLIEPFSKEQTMDILQHAAVSNPWVLSKIRKLADKDPAHRKLFVRGLGWGMTAETLKSVFSQYGAIEECSVIKDKSTGKSKGYGFVTFVHMDAARRALQEPSKTIEGRVTVSQLASVGPTVPSGDQSGRKIYVGNVPHDVTAEKLLSVFSQYGDIEEGPIGFDKKSGKSKGYALIIYKSAESAKKALREAVKYINGHQVNCKMATSDGGGQKGKAESVDLSLSHASGGIGGTTATNLALSGFLPLNQGLLGQHSLTPALTAQGLLALNANSGLNSSFHQASLAHQLALGSSLNTSLGPSLSSTPLNTSLATGISQGLSSYGLHGLEMYGSQGGGLGGSAVSSLYGASMNSMASQTGLLQGTGQGYPSSQLGQGSGGRSQSLSSYFGN